MTIKLPESEVAYFCSEHHFTDTDANRQRKRCGYCGMAKATFDKWSKKAEEAEQTPDEFDDWVIEVFQEMLTCKKHRHIVSTEEGA